MDLVRTSLDQRPRTVGAALAGAGLLILLLGGSVGWFALAVGGLLLIRPRPGRWFIDRFGDKAHHWLAGLKLALLGAALAAFGFLYLRDGATVAAIFGFVGAAIAFFGVYAGVRRGHGHRNPLAERADRLRAGAQDRWHRRRAERTAEREPALTHAAVAFVIALAGALAVVVVAVLTRS